MKEDRGEVEGLKVENEDLRTQVELELSPLRDSLEERENHLATAKTNNALLRQSLEKSARELANMQRMDARRKVAADEERLGRAVVERSGTSLHETWVDGFEWKHVLHQLLDLQTEREGVEKRRKDFVKRRASIKKRDEAEGQTPQMAPPPAVRPPDVPFEDTVDYLNEQEDICKVQVQILKKQETALLDRKGLLLRERELHIREIRRFSDERSSEFSANPMLNHRYLLLNLLGRGGFSQVFKAVDMTTGQYVACKIHQLASNWSEEKKRSFIRHAMREYEIHKSLNHPRVVRLADIFEIDENTFCTVLEYCKGSDLDSHLRANKTLNEKEARSIVAQVFSGLLYLAEQKRRIIHYDLKPGNILLHKGHVQITDFGLSKIMNETQSTTDVMELTSQGAGTMWYLPPECFDAAGQAKINQKVDVWSAGVILFQMLYGRKPFGHDQSQTKMFREKTVQHQELCFPPKPTVSDLAKDFMKKCLTRKAADRPDVRQVLMHPFLRKR